VSSEEAVEPAAKRAGSGPVRLVRAWRALPHDRRLAAGAALGLFLALFLPWYQETGLASAGSRVQTATVSLTGWAAFSWVEAAVLLVAVGVLALLFLRIEGRAFHLPGGDGVIVMLAGGWTFVLVIWRIFDKQGVTSRGQFATTSGIEWGIFIALGVAGMLAYAGSRIRAAHLPEPPLPGDEPPAGHRRQRAEPAAPFAAAGTARRRRADLGSSSGDADREPWPADAVTRVQAAPVPHGGEAPTAKRVSRARRAPWAEPVTWDEPPAATELTAITRVAQPTDGAAEEPASPRRAPPEG
jgi:hypothetical protein